MVVALEAEVLVGLTMVMLLVELEIAVNEITLKVQCGAVVPSARCLG